MVMEKMNKPKPLGLKIIAWWFVVGSGLSILLMALLGPALAKEAGLSARDILISASISVLVLIAGVGLLRVKRWSWYMGLILESLSLAYQLIVIPSVAKKGLAPSQLVAVAIGLAIYGVIITYLLRQDIRELFGVSKPVPPEEGNAG